ncbi:MAG TPA: transglycosylase SLT domain-containing protein [Cellvibrio sp.]|nr:transglycosylase SLT domain-containing protein [Cellvibrio sp.]
MVRKIYPAFILLCAFLVLISLVKCTPATAYEIPAAAKQHRDTLVRSAHAVWGLNAPVATFAAQVHQESRWNVNAKSPVGAEGLAQFMPTTTEWIAAAYPKHLAAAQPYNPGWAMRALVQYDRWLFSRNTAINECDHWAMVLSGYNGGQGWVNRDRKLALASGANGLVWFHSIEKFNAGRSAANFKENRHYPRVILSRWEPLYVAAGWGAGVCVGFDF